MESKEAKKREKQINKQVEKTKTYNKKSFKDINRERLCTNEQ
jgi:hypothetical protein